MVPVTEILLVLIPTIFWDHVNTCI